MPQTNTFRSNADPDLDGQLVKVDGSVLGVFENSDNSPVQVYTIENPDDAELSSLHTWPIGIIDHALGLVGSDGFYNLQDIVNPKPTDSDSHWQTFKLGSDGLVTNDLPGVWRVYPGGNGWELKWVDGK
jgi:hypothetical protein